MVGWQWRWMIPLLDIHGRIMKHQKVSGDTSIWSDHSTTSAAILTWQCKSNEASVLGVKRDQTDWIFLINVPTVQPIAKPKTFEPTHLNLGPHWTTQPWYVSDLFTLQTMTFCEDLWWCSKPEPAPRCRKCPCTICFRTVLRYVMPKLTRTVEKTYSRPDSSQEKFWNQTKRVVHFLNHSLKKMAQKNVVSLRHCQVTVISLPTSFCGPQPLLIHIYPHDILIPPICPSIVIPKLQHQYTPQIIRFS